MGYHETVMELVRYSINQFSLQVGDNHDTPHIGQIPPDIWVDGKKLYKYQTLENEEGQGYMLTYGILPMLDPYRYADDSTSFTTTVIPLDSGRTLITMSEISIFT